MTATSTGPSQETASRILQCYDRLYGGLSAAQVKERDPDFYHVVESYGLVPELGNRRFRSLVPPKPRDWKHMSDADVLMIYQTEHSGIRRGLLAQIDMTLYQQMIKRKSLTHVPTTRPRYPSLPDEHLLMIYRMVYDGTTQGRLEKQEAWLHSRMKRQGLLHHVPRVVRRSWKSLSDAQVLAVYETHHSGRTRRQLRKEDNELYQEFSKRDLLKHVPVNDASTTSLVINGS